jgi:hypothetical protein
MKQSEPPRTTRQRATEHPVSYPREMVNVVIGAGGGTGLECVKRLLAVTQDPVRAVVRDPSAYAAAFPDDPRLAVVAGDATSKESLVQCLAGAAGVIYAASGKGYRSAPDVDNKVGGPAPPRAPPRLHSPPGRPLPGIASQPYVPSAGADELAAPACARRAPRRACRTWPRQPERQAPPAWCWSARRWCTPPTGQRRQAAAAAPRAGASQQAWTRWQRCRGKALQRLSTPEPGIICPAPHPSSSAATRPPACPPARPRPVCSWHPMRIMLNNIRYSLMDEKYKGRRCSGRPPVPQARRWALGSGRCSGRCWLSEGAACCCRRCCRRAGAEGQRRALHGRPPRRPHQRPRRRGGDRSG